MWSSTDERQDELNTRGQCPPRVSLHDSATITVISDTEIQFQTQPQGCRKGTQFNTHNNVITILTIQKQNTSGSCKPALLGPGRGPNRGAPAPRAGTLVDTERNVQKKVSSLKHVVARAAFQNWSQSS
jgi:hypothetical protein